MKPLLCLLLLLMVASAPPPGSDDYEALHPFADWIGSVRNIEHETCCEIADGTVVDVRERDGKLQIRFKAFDRFPDAPRDWIFVPADAVVVQPNRAGVPIAWWWHGLVRCFLNTSAM